MTEERRTHVPPERVAGRIPVRPGVRHILTLGVEVRMLLHVLDDSVTKRDVIILHRSDGEGEEQRVEMQGLEEVRTGYVEAIFTGVLPGLAYDCTIEPGGDSEKVYPVFVKTIIANDDGAFEILMPEEEEESEGGEAEGSGAQGSTAQGSGAQGSGAGDSTAAGESEDAGQATEEEDEGPSPDLVDDGTGETWSEEALEFYGRGVITDDFYEGVEEQEEGEEREGFGGSADALGAAGGSSGGSGEGGPAGGGVSPGGAGQGGVPGQA
jgi:hypothetical protein